MTGMMTLSCQYVGQALSDHCQDHCDLTGYCKHTRIWVGKLGEAR